MIIETTSPLFGGWRGTAEVTTQHPDSRFGQPILLVDGRSVDRLSAYLAGYRLIEANDEERSHLRRAGYPL